MIEIIIYVVLGLFCSVMGFFGGMVFGTDKTFHERFMTFRIDLEPQSLKLGNGKMVSYS